MMILNADEYGRRNVISGWQFNIYGLFSYLEIREITAEAASSLAENLSEKFANTGIKQNTDQDLAAIWEETQGTTQLRWLVFHVWRRLLSSKHSLLYQETRGVTRRLSQGGTLS